MPPDRLGPSQPGQPPLGLPDPAGEVDFVCNEGENSGGLNTPLRRLSRSQLHNTVAAVLGSLFEAETQQAALGELARSLRALPIDQRGGSEGGQAGQQQFLRSDQSIGAVSVGAQMGLAESIAQALAIPDRLSSMGFECLVNGDDEDDGPCLDDFVARLGLLSHRRPLDAAETEFYRREVYDGGDFADVEAIRFLLHVLFAQPHFLLHVEGTGELTSYELASRLSYQFWDSMPDAELLDAAESGELLSEEGLGGQVDRILEDPRARDAIGPFLREWLRFDQVAAPSSGASLDFDYITMGATIDADFDQAVEDELIDLFIHVLRSGGSFEDFVLSGETTTTNETLAGIYGVDPSVSGEPVALPPERRGLLTRVGALLPRGEVVIPRVDSITHPILRGVFVVRQINCQNLRPPEPDVFDNLPTIDRTRMGAREATTVLTGNGTCASCHNAINPAGFALESFGPLGHYRQEEALFDENGIFVRSVPVDDVVMPSEGESIQGGAELSAVIYESESIGACFSRHYTRFSLARFEVMDSSSDTPSDGCLLASVDEAIDANLPLRDVLASLVLQPSFRVRGDN